MIVEDFLSTICNETSKSIWIFNDFSSCFYKVSFGFFLQFAILVVIVYNLGRRVSCPYHLWTFPLALIRLSSLVLLVNASIYFSSQTTSRQWIDIFNTLIIFISVFLMNYLHFNRNLYHPERPRCLTLSFFIVFLIENFDFYRIAIGHTTLIESVYISVRQLCFALITLALLVICQHQCQRPSTRNSTGNFHRSD